MCMEEDASPSSIHVKIYSNIKSAEVDLGKTQIFCCPIISKKRILFLANTRMEEATTCKFGSVEPDNRISHNYVSLRPHVTERVP